MRCGVFHPRKRISTFLGGDYAQIANGTGEMVQYLSLVAANWERRVSTVGEKRALGPFPPLRDEEGATRSLFESDDDTFLHCGPLSRGPQ